MNNLLILLIVVAIVILFYLYKLHSLKREVYRNTIQIGGESDDKDTDIERKLSYKTLGVSAPFSFIDQNIADGNGISIAGKDNPIYYKDKFKNDCDKPSYVYFGTPNPLVHQMKPMAVPKDTMFYFANAEASPECCLGGAPYSTSSGCVCSFAKQLYKCPKEKITLTPIPGPNSWQLF